MADRIQLTTDQLTIYMRAVDHAFEGDVDYGMLHKIYRGQDGGLTNAFSKKAVNHAAMVALYFMWYNFGRIHQTLRVTPAMEAGVSDHVWSAEEIVGLLEAK